MLSQKRPKPKQQLSPLQKKNLLRISAVLVIVAVLWIVFAPGTGVVTLLKKRQELHSLQQKAVQLEEDNEKLKKEIERLQNDSGYLEEIARKEYGLLRKNEQVYDFSPKKSKKEEE